MSKINFEQSKLGKFFSGKGFYVVLAFCLLAVGAAAWTAVNTLQAPPIDTGELSTSFQSESSDNSLTNVGKAVSDAIDDRSSSSADKSSSRPAASSNTSSAAEVAAPKANFFVLPVTGDIIKKFSDTELQYSETFRDMRIHYGVDIAADKGTRVNSAGDGTVSDVFDDPLWGSTVVIDHGNGLIGYYCGLNKQPTVKKGDVVEAGTQLGSIDTIPCESLDSPHLHLAFKKDDKWVSPLKLMEMEE